MDLKTWCQQQSDDPSPAGRLIRAAACQSDPETFFVAVSKDMNRQFRVEYRAIAHSVIAEFKRQGGKFRHPKWFDGINPGTKPKADVLEFRLRPAEQGSRSVLNGWMQVYCRLLDLEPEAEVSDLPLPASREAVVEPLFPKAGTRSHPARDRRKAF